LGAGRPQLAGQFLGEAVLTTALGTVLAAMLASLALPAFNQTAGTQLSLDVVLAPAPLVAGLGLVGLVGLAAGSYPAFVLSHFQPAAVLKSADRHAAGGHGTRLRQGLVVLQLAITIALVAGTFVVEQQFRFVQTKRLGLEKEQVIAVDRAWTLGEGQEAFVERVRQLPGVAAAAAGERLFDDATSNTVFVPDDAPMSDGFSIDFLDVDARFVETLGIEVVSGRSFDPDRPGDAQALLVNEAAAKAFGWTEAEGHRLRHSFDDGAESYPVIGIVRNFHYQSMRQAVQPLVLQLGDVNTLIYVRAEPGAAPQVLDGLRAAWADVKPSEPLPYAFLDQTYAALHRDVERAGRLFTVFAALAVLIACLGLFGLATYTAQRRTKEIGIRKAMGATTLQLTWLLNREVAVLVGIGFAVAAPVAYVSLRRWLEGFAYRIDLGAGVFVLAGVLALVVALGTVGVQAYRAACLDPTTALRAE
jgi:putative ABC transport system permease protein